MSCIIAAHAEMCWVLCHFNEAQCLIQALTSGVMQVEELFKKHNQVQDRRDGLIEALNSERHVKGTETALKVIMCIDYVALVLIV